MLRPTNNGYLTNIALMSSKHPKLTRFFHRPVKAFCPYILAPQSKRMMRLRTAVRPSSFENLSFIPPLPPETSNIRKSPPATPSPLLLSCQQQPFFLRQLFLSPPFLPASFFHTFPSLLKSPIFWGRKGMVGISPLYSPLTIPKQTLWL